MSERVPVSLILTTLNEESTMDFFSSIYKQTHSPTEITVCDACSKDRTREIIFRWKEIPFGIGALAFIHIIVKEWTCVQDELREHSTAKRRRHIDD